LLRLVSPMELAGRDRELDLAAGAVEDVRGGRSRVLGVVGEAGIGKTALLGAIAERAATQRLLVLHGRGVEHEREVPFGVAVDLLDAQVEALDPGRAQALGPDLGAVLPTAAALGEPVLAGVEERFRYHRALRALLELLGRERPLAVLLDDLHWADDASLELVLHLLRRPPGVPHLLVFAARPNGASTRLLDAARSAPGFAALALEPLGDDAALGLLADVRDPAVRRRVAREARGNPLFLRELARAAGRPGAALPDTLLAAVGVELAALPARTRTLLEGAAVAGDPFDAELAAAAAGLDFDAATLDALVAAGLVRPAADGREFAFRHPLVHRAVYDAAPPAWRLSAHRRAAVALELDCALPAARAFHVARYARPGDEAAIALMTEAGAAAAETAPASAARWYGVALRLLPHGDRARRAELAAPRGLALVTAGRLPEGREALVEALELLGPEPTAQRLELVIACAQVEAQLGSHRDARRRLLAALEHAPPAGRAAIAFELATTAMMHNEVEEVREWAQRAAQAAAADPLLTAGADALRALAASLTPGGDAGEAADWLDRAVAALAELDDSALAAHVHVPLHIGRAQLRLQRFRGALETFDRALSVALGSHQGQMLVHLRAVRAITRWLLLDLDGALVEVEAAEEGARLNGAPHQLLIALWLRTMAHHHRGEADAAERAAQEFSALARTYPRSALIHNAACNVATIHVDRDPERAIRDMLAAAGPDLRHTDYYWGCSLLLALVRAAIAAGRLDDAERWMARAAMRDCGLGLPASDVRASCARAEILLARGAAREAAELAEQAAAAADRIPAPMDATDARLLMGRALAAAGETEGAKRILQQVAVDGGRGGALRLRNAAQRELRRLGTRVSAEGRRAERGSLTEREQQVAELVAHGHPNKQVGAALFLSEKTIQNTLTRVYAKLGVRSRTQLTRALLHS
jgi:DNA-binding NarL/FixJ family response regulator